MTVIPIGLRSKPARGRFWRAFAERLDALVAYPAKHAISERELRRADEDIRRCRQLMFQKQQQQRGMKLARAAATRPARTRNG